MLRPSTPGVLHTEVFMSGSTNNIVNPLNAELNPIRHLLALVGARHIVHVSGIRVKHPVLIALMLNSPLEAYPPNIT